MLSRRNLLVAMPGVVLAQRMDKGPALEASLVKEFVIAAHAKLERTEQMLAENPKVINCTWDWGGGDFETGLGGASHMGAKEIAQMLLTKGARMDLFAAAMLGKVEIIRAAVQAFPGIQQVAGPHGITLLAHARKGGSEETIRYLESLG